MQISEYCHSIETLLCITDTTKDYLPVLPGCELSFLSIVQLVRLFYPYMSLTHQCTNEEPT